MKLNESLKGKQPAPTKPKLTLQESMSEGQAADAAHKLGLVAKGWGQWVDKTGKVIAKTVNDKLQKVNPNDQKKGKEAPSFDSRGDDDYFSDEEMGHEINKQKDQRSRRNMLAKKRRDAKKTQSDDDR